MAVHAFKKECPLLTDRHLKQGFEIIHKIATHILELYPPFFLPPLHMVVVIAGNLMRSPGSGELGEHPLL